MTRKWPGIEEGSGSLCERIWTQESGLGLAFDSIRPSSKQVVDSPISVCLD